MSSDIFLDAGVFIGALLKGDSRHHEARSIVEEARAGRISAATTIGILCEVYAALTWEKAQPQHHPDEAANAVYALVQTPSRIRLLAENENALDIMLHLAKSNNLHARRIHDARHAATAIAHGIKRVMTYDTGDWLHFEKDGLQIVDTEKTETISRSK